jgi:hypothetical protein
MLRCHWTVVFVDANESLLDDAVLVDQLGCSAADERSTRTSSRDACQAGRLTSARPSVLIRKGATCTKGPTPSSSSTSEKASTGTPASTIDAYRNAEKGHVTLTGSVLTYYEKVSSR